MPQPDFASFFLAQAAGAGIFEENDNGADEAAPSSEVKNGRKRRGSLAQLHDAA